MTTSQQSRLGSAPEEGMKAPVVTISSGQETLFGIGQSIAGVVIGDMDRVAINAQTDSTENGIYNARGGKDWERATDFNNPDDVENGQLLSDGNTSAVYSVIAPDPWNPGVDTVNFGLLLSPVGFFWGAITGTLSNQADLQIELDAKSDVGHTHVEADITDLQAYILDAPSDGEFYARSDAAWVIIDFSVFAPAVHTHTESDITDLQPYLLDAPSNDELFARANGAWVGFSTASGTTGEIIAWPDADVPQNFLDCNGQSINAVTFADLFAVLGYKYGGSGANFNVPDLRGTFIRGTANGSGNDPERTLRTDRGDGGTGDLVGTKQAAAVGPHAHTFNAAQAIGGFTDNGGAPDIRTTLQNKDTGTSGPGIGGDTRPINMYMNYIIRYTGGGSGITQPPSIEVQDNGVPLTTAVQLLNFINFNLDQPLTDQVDVRYGSSQNAGQYCPGYDFTFVDTTVWHVVGLDVTQTFRSRRCRFIDGAANYYGTVLSANFSGGNTVLTMNMEDGEVLTNSISEVCLTTAAAAWSAIAEDPFSGGRINDICTGVIGTTQYWVAVGNNGQIHISSNAGLNWVQAVMTGTALDFRVCVYDSTHEMFHAGGQTGVLAQSSDGLNWTLDTTSIPTLVSSGGDGSIAGFTYMPGGDWLSIFYQEGPTVYFGGNSVDQGATWVARANSSIQPAINKATTTNWTTAAPATGYGYVRPANTALWAVTNEADVSYSNQGANAGALQGTFIFVDPDTGVVARIYPLVDSRIDGAAGWTGLQAALPQLTNDMAYLDIHDRVVAVGPLGQIAYWNRSDKLANNAWVVIPNGFDPLADILAINANEVDGIYIAVASNGQICRSTNGLGDPVAPIVFAGWTAIAADPFSGTRINRIMAGSIGGTNYWVIAGETGQLFTSIDAGVTWTQRTTGTTQEILVLEYSSATSTFFAGCAGGDFLTSTDGTTWVLDNTTLAALGTTGSFAVSVAWYDTFAGMWWIIFQDASTQKETRTTTDFITWTLRDTSVVQNSAQRGIGKGSVVDNRLFFCNVDDLMYYDGATDTVESSWFGETSGDYKIACHIESGTDGNARDIAIGSVSGLLQQIDTGIVDAATVGDGNQINSIHKSTISNRWIAVGNAGSILTLDGLAFKTASWFPVSNPFVNNITDVHYDATDDMFIAVAQDGVICRSVDGIS